MHGFCITSSAPVNVVHFANGETYYESIQSAGTVTMKIRCDCFEDSVEISDFILSIPHYNDETLKMLYDGAMSLSPKFLECKLDTIHGLLSIDQIVCDYLLLEINRRKDIRDYEKEIAGYVARS